ncbi:MAG: carbon-nitrogen hydrolase family protein [Candidatus Marinimicrobia bacterium]|nr:carbon-nitrogen hydrolase family protein [Candidatus Neomarinimicrobiota bacterium]MBL7010479.1 carbon-nitrogen hydrolase family protein [Candidatus Neomarinimicrobiota bacterium]MBL7030918.1 carbon-nitrogen hydrolase family protein [Candidatus Neomarinimicrobiota bacterium]
MKIALIQQHASKNIETNIQRGLDNLDNAAQQGAELAVFAELSFTRFYPQFLAQSDVSHLAESVPGPTTEKFMGKAMEHNMVVVINLLELENGKTYDSSPVIDADGTLLGTTRMVHIADYECFYEKSYYTEGDHGAPVYDTKIGKIGVAICYDRHYPEYMRALALNGAELVVIPQAGTVGEWPEGLYEAELQVASFQNGYFCALANRVGVEDQLSFAGESFITNPQGKVLTQSPMGQDDILISEIDLRQVAKSNARTMFFRDRRPKIYPLNKFNRKA